MAMNIWGKKWMAKGYKSMNVQNCWIVWEKLLLKWALEAEEWSWQMSAFQRALWCAWGRFRLSHSPSGPVADEWSAAQVWQRYGSVWSAGKGWWWLLGGAVQDGAGSPCVCFDSSSAVTDSLCSLPGFALCQGVLRTAHPVTWVALLAGNRVWTNCTNLLGGIQYLQGKSQPGEQHELLGCYQTSSSMLIWVRNACISQWNKTIIAWLIEYTKFQL